MTTEQAERERREESLRRCRENEKAVKVRMREEEPRYSARDCADGKPDYTRYLLAWL